MSKVLPVLQISLPDKNIIIAQCWILFSKNLFFYIYYQHISNFLFLQYLFMVTVYKRQVLIADLLTGYKLWPPVWKANIHIRP